MLSDGFWGLVSWPRLLRFIKSWLARFAAHLFLSDWLRNPFRPDRPLVRLARGTDANAASPEFHRANAQTTNKPMVVGQTAIFVLYQDISFLLACGVARILLSRKVAIPTGLAGRIDDWKARACRGMTDSGPEGSGTRVNASIS